MSVLLFLLGLIVGSFLSAFTYRFPRGIQFLVGRSFCPRCKEKIAWYDNIPLLSYIFLGGKCRRCSKKISLRYPLIELATGIGFFFIGLNLYWLLIFGILAAIFVIDLEHQIIPDELIFVGIALNAIYSLQFANFFAGFACASVLLLIHLITRGRGMGLGDVKFAVLGGMIVGFKLSLVWLFLAFLTGAFVAVILVLARKAKLKGKIAFGPFLTVSIFLTLVYGEKILSWIYTY